MKKKSFLMFGLCVILAFPMTVSADLLNYEATINTYKQDNKTTHKFQGDDGTGSVVQAVAKDETVYVAAKYTVIRSNPGEKGSKLRKVILGTTLERVAVCDNGWSKVSFEKKGKDKIIGYVPDSALSDKSQLKNVKDTLKVIQDSDILDFPGKKDGQVVGEVIQEDEVQRTGTVNDIWSRIYYLDANGKKQTGYIPTNVLEGQEEVTEVAKAEEETTKIDGDEAGTIHESAGTGVFADAVEGVTAVGGSSTTADGVLVGTPEAVSSDASLVPLGTFRITHYCPCSICCGPYANGITSTGVTAVTNHTIAVNPSQIPYGSKVVINGQVYVAEDCGGAIVDNCIDIYVATHDEGENKGVFYTDVYLLQ